MVALNIFTGPYHKSAGDTAAAARSDKMTYSRLAVTLTLSMICITNAVQITYAASSGGRDVEHLISYTILGPRDHPFPIVYVSDQHFPTNRGEFLVVLPQARFDIFSAYTRARLSRPDCPGQEPVGNVWYTVQIAQQDKEMMYGCALLQALACDYLSDVVNLPGINWTAEELKPITDFVLEIRCGPRRID
jgi:hypothetical protein